MAKKLDLSTFTLAQLKTLRNDIADALKGAETDARRAALADAEKAAQKHGFSLKDLMGGKTKQKSAKAPAAPKYRNPDDAAATWSGRGRPPVWFKEAVAKGVKPEKMAI